MKSPDGRSPVARAWEWATRIMTISVEMVLPGLAGYWVDQRLKTLPLFMLIGFALGCTLAVVSLKQLVRSASARRTNAAESETRDQIS